MGPVYPVTERRVGTLLSLFFFMTFAFWLPDAPLLPELYPPRRGVLETVALWPLDLWTGVPVTSLLWSRAQLYLLGLVALGAMYGFLMDRYVRLATLALAGLLAAKLAYLSWDLRYLTGADVTHVTLTALFLLGRPRVLSLRVGLMGLSLIGVVNRMNPAWLAGELLPEAFRGLAPLQAGALLLEAAAPLLWLSGSQRARRVGVGLWLGLQGLSWAALSLLWPSSLAACGPLLLVGGALLVPLEKPLQEDYAGGPGAFLPAVLLGGLLAIALWPGPTRGWLHVYELDALRAIRSRIVVTRGNSQVTLHTETPSARSWNPEVGTRVQATAVVAGELARQGGRLADPLRLDGTLVFSPHRFRGASSGLLADPLFFRSYVGELRRTFRPDRLQLELEVNGARVWELDWRNPDASLPASLDQLPGEGDTLK